MLQKRNRKKAFKLPMIAKILEFIIVCNVQGVTLEKMYAKSKTQNPDENIVYFGIVLLLDDASEANQIETELLQYAELTNCNIFIQETKCTQEEKSRKCCMIYEIDVTVNDELYDKLPYFVNGYRKKLSGRIPFEATEKIITVMDIK